ncbi:hypothetical protein [uncultured Treponema sp.]|uniref:hypothetical protein n=1 Tax=uncultured Treponema sp. TaxID=162155 RepID=UPI0025F21C0B|nr:hypothetical protein [uncultured Treponema sp.]
MKGKYSISISNNKVKYEFSIKRNISEIINDSETKNILENPEEYIESKDFFSWEQFFTKLLIEKTDGTYLKYSKRKLNPNYLSENVKNKILNSDVMEAIVKRM